MSDDMIPKPYVYPNGQASPASLYASIDQLRKQNESLRAQLADTEKALADAMKDARRYRWLRDQSERTYTVKWTTPFPTNPDAECDQTASFTYGRMANEYMDAAIDAALPPLPQSTPGEGS
jgi:hypothetical protein